jgi:hypothetical protein
MPSPLTHALSCLRADRPGSVLGASELGASQLSRDSRRIELERGAMVYALLHDRYMDTFNAWSWGISMWNNRRPSWGREAA